MGTNRSGQVGNDLCDSQNQRGAEGTGGLHYAIRRLLQEGCFEPRYCPSIRVLLSVIAVLAYLVIHGLKKGKEHRQENVRLLEVGHGYEDLLEVGLARNKGPSTHLEDDLLLLLVGLPSLLLHFLTWAILVKRAS